MFGFLKKIFYKKECYACKTLKEKILCVRKHLVFDPYSEEYRSLKLKFIHKNINNSIDNLTIIKNGIETNNFIAPKITETNVMSYSMSRWFTDDDHNIIYNTTDKWEEYIDLHIWLIDWYDENIKDFSNPKYGVSYKLKPYIINIELVLDALIEFQKQEINM